MIRVSLLICFIIFNLFARAQLNAIHNSIRVGDVITKQQVEFKDPGEAKPNQIWNFSKLTLINEEYEVEYNEAPLIGDSAYYLGCHIFPKKIRKVADLIIGTEHNTMYYFYQDKDSLTLLGHENVAIKQQNLQPIINLKFPLNYGEDPTISTYKTRGLYSSSVDVKSEGNIIMYADAFGKMILPLGDTINPVLRVKVEQTILDTSTKLDSSTEEDKGRVLETYRWYSKGYRYPIFETIETIDLNTDSILFSTAFYFPLQDHLYLDTDPENLALLDELWDYTGEHNNKRDLFEETYNKKNYSIYPNPVSDILNIEYTLEQDVSVNIIMTSIDGKVVKNVSKKQQTGIQYERLDCSSLLTGVYLIKIVAGEMVINERIMKIQ